MTNIEKNIIIIKNLIKERNFVDARIKGEQLVFIHSANAELNYLMGYIYDKLNLIQRAEEFLHNALNLNPNHYDTLVELSLFHEKNGERDKATLYRERSFRIANRIKQ